MKKIILVLAIVAGFIIACFIHSEIEIIVAEKHVERTIESFQKQQAEEQERIRQAEYENEARLLDSLRKAGY